jgi:protein phosphatase
VLQQAAGVWCTPVPAGPASEEVTRRCRHAVAAVGPYVFIFGGLRGSTLLDDFLLADDSSGTELSICDPRSPAWWESALLQSVDHSVIPCSAFCTRLSMLLDVFWILRPVCICRRQWLDAEHGTQAAAAMLAEAAAEEAAAAAALGVRRVGTMEDLTCIDEDLGDG